MKIAILLSILLLFTNNSMAISHDSKNVIRLQKGRPLQSQIIQPNCTFEVPVDFDGQGVKIEMPPNSGLKFVGGKISNATIIGHNSNIDSDVRQIFENVNIEGSWNNNYFYSEWFGAVGDGIHDDTKSIREVIQAAKGHSLVFLHKTYIVNVDPGTDNYSQRIVFSNCKCAKFLGNKSTIRIGSNDNCNLYAYKGFGALFSVYTIDSFHVEGITFDFNYEHNPIYQTQGVRQSIQENTQQNAFQFRRVRKVVIEGCTFIGHSGTNCIDYNDARYDKGDMVFEVSIKKCRFLKSGGKSFYKENGRMVDAYHDCSTIALHYRGDNHSTKFKVDVSNNYFEGIGGNAYNVIETDASDFIFRNNIIKKYASGVIACSGVYEGNFAIANNKFYDVCRAVNLWLRGDDEGKGKYGYNFMDIRKNTCSINMDYWYLQPRYDNIGNIHSKRYGFIFTASGSNMLVRHLSVRNNIIRYTNLVDDKEVYNPLNPVDLNTSNNNYPIVKCDYLDINNNRVYDNHKLKK